MNILCVLDFAAVYLMQDYVQLYLQTSFISLLSTK